MERFSTKAEILNDVKPKNDAEKKTNYDISETLCFYLLLPLSGL